MEWAAGLRTKRFEDHTKENDKVVKNMLTLTKDYNERVKEEEGKTAEEVLVANVGKIDPKRHLENDLSDLMASNIVQCLGTMLATVVF